MAIVPLPRNSPRRDWVLHYTDPRITVTSWYVQTADGTRYPLEELDGVLRVLTFAHPGRTVALIVGGVEVVVAVPYTVAYQSVPIFVAGLMAAAGLAAGVLADARTNPRWMELRGIWRGTEVLLFRSRKLDEFERVRWAMIRATEPYRDPAP